MVSEQEHTVELFCGPEKPFSSIANFLGYSTFTFDEDPASGADVTSKIAEADQQKFPSNAAMVWAAPPADGFEDKAGWDNFSPVTPAAIAAERYFGDCLTLTRHLRPKWWFIEAPKSYLRKLPLTAGFNRGDPSRIRHTINPGDYGGTSRKEIDLWTNAFWWIPLPRAEVIEERPAITPALNSSRLPPMVYLEALNQFDAYMRNKGERA